MKYMLLMTQREAAARIASGAASRLSNPMSITIAGIAEASVVRNVPRSAFYPAPRVDSAVVEIKFSGLEGAPFELPRDAAWRRLVAGSFVTRRKTLVNNWGSSFHLPRGKSLEILSSHSLGALTRPEELTLENWLALYRNSDLALNLSNGG
jgi:16S rRNA (adenine1518-N6/adenine1519-N6)-dimethyltransferase